MLANNTSGPRLLPLALAAGMALAAGFLAWWFVPPWLYCGQVVAYATWVIDASNDRELAGFADDIFFGRVAARAGQTMVDGLPQTDYRVEVLETLKGSAAGVISVSQQGGIMPEGGCFRMDGDPDLMEAGKTYLLATLRIIDRNGESNGGGNMALSGGGGYGKIELPEAAVGESILNTPAAGELRTRFADAIANQIPFVHEADD